MGKKKGGKKGKKGGGKGEPKKVLTAEEKEALAKAEKERIEKLWELIKKTAKLTHTYAKDIEHLRAESKKRERDSTDMVLYLEQEVKRKENANLKLEKHVEELQAMQTNDEKTMKRHFEDTLKRAEKVFLVKERQLVEKNNQLQEEVSRVLNVLMVLK